MRDRAPEEETQQHMLWIGRDRWEELRRGEMISVSFADSTKHPRPGDEVTVRPSSATRTKGATFGRAALVQEVRAIVMDVQRGGDHVMLAEEDGEAYQRLLLEELLSETLDVGKGTRSQGKIMSRVTDVILTFSVGDAGGMQTVNRALLDPADGQAFVLTSAHVPQDEVSGGGKALQAGIAMAAFNYVSDEVLIEAVRSHDWKMPERVHLFVQGEHDENGFTDLPWSGHPVPDICISPNDRDLKWLHTLRGLAAKLYKLGGGFGLSEDEMDDVGAFHNLVNALTKRPG